MPGGRSRVTGSGLAGGRAGALGEGKCETVAGDQVAPGQERAWGQMGPCPGLGLGSSEPGQAADAWGAGRVGVRAQQQQGRPCAKAQGRVRPGRVYCSQDTAVHGLPGRWAPRWRSLSPSHGGAGLGGPAAPRAQAPRRPAGALGLCGVDDFAQKEDARCVAGGDDRQERPVEMHRGHWAQFPGQE